MTANRQRKGSDKRQGLVLVEDKANERRTVKLDYLSGHKPKIKLDTRGRQAKEEQERMCEEAKMEAEEKMKEKMADELGIQRKRRRGTMQGGQVCKEN